MTFESYDTQRDMTRAETDISGDGGKDYFLK